jgi:hypothetical protein
MTEIPREFICPITFEIMEDPVICCDGYTYEKSVIMNLPNSLSPLTRQPIDKNNLIPNRNLKDVIERYKASPDNTQLKKLSNMSKLEKFELEQKMKKQEIENKIKKELLEKQKRDNEEFLKKQKEKEQEIELNRILEMFNAQNTALFNYGYVKQYNFGMNQFRNTHYEYCKIGEKKYIFSLDMLKLIKNENKDNLSKKCEELTNNYIWIKKYVIAEETNPLIEFVFDNFVSEIDILLEKELQNLEINKIEFNKIEFIPGHCNVTSLKRQINMLEKKVKLITKIKNKQLKSKEYYIVNYDEFCKDFEITEFLKINISIYGYDWNILYDWITIKKQYFNNLIKNIFNIFDKSVNTLNNISYSYSNQNGNRCDYHHHLLEMYRFNIEHCTQPSPEVNENSRSDLIKDYEPIFFEPLMNLTKNIIELIDFLHEEI